MYRDYDKTLDSNGALRSVHVTIKELLVDASDLLKQEQYEKLAGIYEEISVLASSLRESAEVRQSQQEKEVK